MTKESSQDAKDFLNQHLATRKMFKDHGWPDNFNVRDFREARMKFTSTAERYSKTKDSTWCRKGGGFSVYMTPEIWSAFLRESTGEAAIE